LNQTFDMLGSSGFLDQGGFSSSTAAAVRSSLYESPSSWSEVVSGRGAGEAVGEAASAVNAASHTLLPFAPPIPFLRVAASPTESTLNGHLQERENECAYFRRGSSKRRARTPDECPFI
jgi:hypothetical protein